MTETHRITPGSVPRSGALVGIFVAIFFLIFGGVFFYVVVQETPSSETSLIVVQCAFLILWVIVCSAILVNFIRIYRACDPSDDNTFVKIDSFGPSDDQGDNHAFDSRLRKLESLFQDKLITEDEYKIKRSELLEEKW